MFIDEVSRSDSVGYETFLSFYEPSIKFKGELSNKILKSFLSWGCVNEMTSPYEPEYVHIQCPIENNQITGMPDLLMFDIHGHIYEMDPKNYFVFPTYRENNQGVLATFAMTPFKKE